MGLTYEEIPCNLCGSKEYAIVFPRIEPKEDVPIESRYSAAKGVMCTDQVVKCSRCGLVFINPRPKSGTIVDAVSEGEDEVYVSQPAGRIATFERGLQFIEKNAKKGTILDVGCAAGFFLSVAKARGWKTMGVEPNRWLCEYGNKKYGLHSKPMTLEAAKFKSNSFDVITFWDVFEHLPDPRGTLKTVHKMLKPGGKLIISYPQFGSVLAKMSGRKWWFLLSHHLYYFTWKTIAKMLASEGFKVQTDRMHWQQLQVGYMFTMFRTLNADSFVGTIAGIVEGVLKLLRLYNVKVWYYAAQTDLVAVKTR
jgi:2-polyprenyl-3-methyl-5-hydroxy-6-metoxy-1,4-benzoquinol methylase